MIKRSERRDEIKKQLKRRKRQRLIIFMMTIILVAGLFVFAFLGLYHSFKSGTFNLKHVKVIGNAAFGEQAISDAAEFPDDRPIFLIDFNKAKANIDQHIQTEGLLMTLSFPDTIIIRMKEKPVICATIESDRCYVIGSDRRIIGILDHIGNIHVPVVSGFDGMQDLGIGDRASFAYDKRFDEIEKMLKLLNGNGSIDKISEIGVSQLNTYKIISKNNTSFIVSDFDTFEKNFDLIGTVLNENHSGLEFNLVTGAIPAMKEK